MEEQIGILWHRWVNKLAVRRFPEMAVELTDVARSAALLYRALGGDPGVTVQAGAHTLHGARRSMLQRLAGSERKAGLAWVDSEALRLPSLIDVYPQQRLNRDAYFWLAALCACDHAPELSWPARNQTAVLAVIQDYPGLKARYFRLVDAEIARRPDPRKLPADEALLERSIREALRHPGSVTTWPVAVRPPHPVMLWLRPDAPAPQSAAAGETQQAGTAANIAQTDKKRRSAEHAQLPERKGGMMLFRPETIFSWNEYAKVEHDIEDNDDEDLAQAADDLDVISVARGGRQVAKKLRMELDLPAAAIDQTPLDGVQMLPEWDYRARLLRPAQCRITPILPAQTIAGILPDRLKRDQQRLKRQFEALALSRIRLKAQPDGSDIDIDSYIRQLASGSEERLFTDLRQRDRDLACLLLADLSLSTEAWIGPERSVIDVIRDSLLLFSEALSVTRDRFALYGFNSHERNDVRFHQLKSFDEPYDGKVRSRILGIKPAYYTRMGAAIRRATEILERQRSRERLLLLLTDGKPNDTDHYEGRFGIEDTRKALSAARQQGLRPFCVTVDQEAHGYLPYIFGKHNFIIIRKPSELPARLPLLYSLITR
ncbi:MAG: VWA domain-containing protein [Burkholderiales bacterium]